MRRHLARLASGGHLAAPAESTAAWLTGQSSRRHSRLSPAQLSLLELLEAEGYAPLAAGLPYTRAAVALPYTAEPILRASWRNASQFLAARLDPRVGQEVARHLQPVLDATGRTLLLLCGSAGAELLGAALPHLDVRPSLAVQVVALGPVGRLPSAVSGLPPVVVRGDHDRISRLGSRHRTDDVVVVRGGHLDYAALPEVHDVVRRVARRALHAPGAGGTGGTT